MVSIKSGKEEAGQKPRHNKRQKKETTKKGLSKVKTGKCDGDKIDLHKKKKKKNIKST